MELNIFTDIKNVFTFSYTLSIVFLEASTLTSVCNCTILTVSPPIGAITFGEKKPEKKFWASTGFEPRIPVRCSTRLSREATLLGAIAGHFCGFYLSHEGNR